MSSPTIPAFQYTTLYFSGPEAMAHDCGEEIKEIFIPSRLLIVNAKEGPQPGHEARNRYSTYFRGPIKESPIKTVQLSSTLVDKIVEVAQLKIKTKQKEAEVIADLTTYLK